MVDSTTRISFKFIVTATASTQDLIFPCWLPKAVPSTAARRDTLQVTSDKANCPAYSLTAPHPADTPNLLTQGAPMVVR